jgi:DNA modification methylase
MYADLAEAAKLYEGETAEVVEDEVPEPPADPITKPGDLWTLGDHRLLCGDSTKAEDVERLMAGAEADVCFTSPPYGQQRDYTKEGKEKVADWDGLMCGVFANLPMAHDGQVLVNLGLIHREGEWIPYWDSWIKWMREKGWQSFGWYVWDKKHPMPMRDGGRLLPQHEWIFHFNKQSQDCIKTVKCVSAGQSTGYGLRNKIGEKSDEGTDVVRTHRVLGSVVAASPQEGGAHDHPAVMSVGLPMQLIQCWPGVVYEPFCGSGTTLIAAEQLGRKCYGMEISPQYCDVIVKRWETLTGKKAVLEVNDGKARTTQAANSGAAPKRRSVKAGT